MVIDFKSKIVEKDQNAVVDSDAEYNAIRISMPKDKAARNHILNVVQNYVVTRELTPPLSMEELRCHTQHLLAQSDIDVRHNDLIMIMINNVVWEDTIAAVPYERRLLLIPQCLRSAENCPAEIDELGLLCEQCGGCQIGTIQAEAEGLGYVVLVAEGTTVVTKLLSSGKVDAVVGVSCLSSLERTFPYLAADAVPGIAIPLIYDGCRDTQVDDEWIMKAIRLRSDDRWFGQTEITDLRSEVDSWFKPSIFYQELMSGDQVSTVAFDWLVKSGKRWRPFLVAAIYKALRGAESEIPDAVKVLALAVECFHKASLIHDDIEDEDSTRDGEVTLHCQYGIAIALNTGDLLLGEGYRLIAECDQDGELTKQILSIAADGHRSLCLGQGKELFCMQDDNIPSSSTVLEIFKLKTSPAFEVALCIGGAYAGADEKTLDVLQQFSESLGIAYQIRDDLDDFQAAIIAKDSSKIRASLMPALAAEIADTDTRDKIISAWKSKEALTEVFTLISDLKVEEKAWQLCEHYKNEAVRSLTPLDNASLKSFLRRVIGRIIKKEAKSLFAKI
ncbi:MAG: polyprenyl synthetase family protein [Kiritimatiellae bacterium]|nr:polyprenyl synthetase family protein [Kiritimatiellia bacterium]